MKLVCQGLVVVPLGLAFLAAASASADATGGRRSNHHQWFPTIFGGSRLEQEQEQERHVVSGPTQQQKLDLRGGQTGTTARKRRSASKRSSSSSSSSSSGGGGGGGRTARGIGRSSSGAPRLTKKQVAEVQKQRRAAKTKAKAKASAGTGSKPATEGRSATATAAAAAAATSSSRSSTPATTTSSSGSSSSGTGTGSSATGGILSSGASKMPTLFFDPDETDLDRYAACLAAAEGLRRARDASASSSRVRRALRDLDEGKASSTDSSQQRKRMKKWSDEEQREYETLRASYADNTARTVQSFGLSISRFNELGRGVGADPVLKERVMEQAYLYGMAAGLTGMERVPLIRGKGSAGGGRGGAARAGTSDRTSGRHGTRSFFVLAVNPDEIETFARCLAEVEDLRHSNLEKLRQSLRVDVLPPVMCDPNVRSLLDPRVRAVCDAFPLQAEEVVRKYGMGSDEFNGLLDRLRSDPVFRWRVKRCMSKL